MRSNGWRVILFVGLVVALMAAFVATVTAEETDWSTLIERAKPAVVWIVVETSEGTFAGSGAIISPDGYILTAGHVVKGANKITVVVEESKEYSATIVNADYDMDVALLKISASGLTWLALGDSDKVRYDEEIQVLGYPLPQQGVGYIAVSGKVQGFRTYKDVKLIQHDAPTEGGHSGGPVIDAQGEIIAVHTSWIGGEHSKYTIGVAINSVKRIIPYGVLPSGPSPVQPATGSPAHVGPIRVPQDYPTIQAAVHAAPEGGEIQVSSGTYHSDITITKPVAILGQGEVTVRGTIRIWRTESVYLKDLEMRGSIEIRDSVSISLEKVTVKESSAAGISMERSSVSLTGCTIQNSGGAGIDAAFNTQLVVRECIIHQNSGDGVTLLFGCQGHISNNTIADNDGMGIRASTDTSLSGDHNLGWANAKGAANDSVSDNLTPCIRIPEDLDEMKRIPKGSTGTLVLVSPGTHTVNLSIDSSLTLRGTGEKPADSCIESPSPSDTLHIWGVAKVMIENLTISGGFQGLLVNGAAAVTVQDCIFSSTHVFIGGEARMTLKDSTVEDTKGVSVGGSGVVTIDNCTISENYIGLSLDGHASVSAQESIFSENERSGIKMEGSAQIVLADCHVSGNGMTGLVAKGTARVESRDTTFEGNGVDKDCNDDCNGLSVDEEAHVLLVNVQISSNGGSGLTITGSAQVEIQDSTIDRNGIDGLRVLRSAQANVLHTTFSENEKYGIYAYGRSARAVLKDCIVSMNGRGLVADNQAEVTLRNCTITNNWTGLLVAASAQTSLYDSTVCDSGNSGLILQQTAQVKLEGSTSIYDNGEYGILIRDEESQITGHSIEMHGNWIDLGGFAPTFIRKPLVAQTNKMKVFVPEDYVTIQEAVDAIAPGGTVVLASGTYKEGVTIWKPVSIQGSGSEKTILDASYEHYLVVSICPGVWSTRLEDLQIRGSRGCGVTATGQVHLANLMVAGNRAFGINILKDAKVVIQSSQIQGNGGNGGGGISVQQGEMELTDCWISDNYTGIYGSSNTTISGSNNWVKYNLVDFTSVAPPPGFLRSTSPQPLLKEANVCSTCSFTEPWQAICAVCSGGTIHLRAGSYHTPLVLGKDLILVGEGSASTTVTGGYVSIGGNANVEIRRLSILNVDLLVKGSAQLVLQDFAVTSGRIQISNSAQVSLTNGVVVGTWNGIMVYDLAAVSLKNCSISDIDYRPISLNDSATGTLVNCSIYENDDPIIIRKFATLNLQHCTISKNKTHGLEVIDSGLIRLEECTVSNNGGDGIRVMDRAHATLANSIIQNNAGWGVVAEMKECGFDKQFKGEVILENNEIYDNDAGDICLPKLCVPREACQEFNNK